MYVGQKFFLVILWDVQELYNQTWLAFNNFYTALYSLRPMSMAVNWNQFTFKDWANRDPIGKRLQFNMNPDS